MCTFSMFRRLQEEYWNSAVDIHIIDFSFLDPDHIALVGQADILYVCGGHTYPQLDEALKKPQRNAVAEAVRANVQYDKLLYWGICGGAKIVASTHLDLLLRPGLVIRYDSSTSPLVCDHLQSADTIQFTTGCALLMHFSDKGTMAECVPIVKKACVPKSIHYRRLGCVGGWRGLLCFPGHSGTNVDRHFIRSRGQVRRGRVG